LLAYLLLNKPNFAYGKPLPCNVWPLAKYSLATSFSTPVTLP